MGSDGINRADVGGAEGESWRGGFAATRLSGHEETMDNDSDYDSLDFW